MKPPSKRPQFPPFGHVFRFAWPDDSVRFASLPKAKRYPTTEPEWSRLLARHREISNFVLLPGASCQIFLLWYVPTAPTFAGLRLRHIRMPYGWRNFRFMDGGKMYTSDAPWDFASFEQLLRLRADDAAGPIGVWCPARQTIYSPYDGGADIYSENLALLQEITAKFNQWKMNS